jgi:hypothetical protein
MSKLRDLLHNAGLKPMTKEYDEVDQILVFAPPANVQKSKLQGETVKFTVYGPSSQFPDYMDAVTKRTLMERMFTLRTLQWKLPVIMAKQFSTTMLNRNVESTDIKRHVYVILRATANFNNRAWRADVKVAVTMGNNRTLLYFAR